MHKFYKKKNVVPGVLQSLLGGAGVIQGNITQLKNSGDHLVFDQVAKDIIQSIGFDSNGLNLMLLDANPQLKDNASTTDLYELATSLTAATDNINQNNCKTFEDKGFNEFCKK